MSEWFSEEELERIEQFAKAPRHAREPGMLLPGEAEAIEDPGEDTAEIDPDGTESGTIDRRVPEPND